MLLYARKYIRGRMLDLGAGKAKYADIFRSVAGEYLTCDMIAAPHIDFVEDAHNLSFPDNSFDTVLCNQALEHVARPWEVAAQISRILKPGGHAIITVPFIAGEHRDPTDFFRFTADGITSLFPNLVVVECEKCGGAFSIFGSMWKFAFASPYKKVGRFRRRFSILLQQCCKKLDRFSPAGETLYAGTFLVLTKK